MNSDSSVSPMASCRLDGRGLCPTARRSALLMEKTSSISTGGSSYSFSIPLSPAPISAA